MSAPSGLGRQLGEKSITVDGVKVRSKSEKKIADFLVSHGVKYEYEKMLRTWALGSKISFPDFYLPEYKVYIEYWGLANEENYNLKMRRKLAKYHQIGLKWINLYEQDLNDLELSLSRKFKERTGLDFPLLRKAPQNRLGS